MNYFKFSRLHRHGGSFLNMQSREQQFKSINLPIFILCATARPSVHRQLLTSYQVSMQIVFSVLIKKKITALISQTLQSLLIKCWRPSEVVCYYYGLVLTLDFILMWPNIRLHDILHLVQHQHQIVLKPL